MMYAQVTVRRLVGKWDSAGTQETGEMCKYLRRDSKSENSKTIRVTGRGGL
jgi:hypothetical protein